MCIYMDFWTLYVYCAGEKRLLTLPDPLMYGILSSTTGISSIGFLQRQDLFRKKKKKKIDIFSHKLQLQSQAGRHKSNVYFKGGKKNSSGFPPMSLWALGLSVTRFIDSIEYCNRNIQFFHSSDDVRGAASWSQRRMTKTMECGSFDRKSLFAEVLRQHCSRRSQVLMSPSDCWVKHLWEITAD